MPSSTRPQTRAAIPFLLLAACAAVPAKSGTADPSGPSGPSTSAASSLQIADPFPTQDTLDAIAARPAPDPAALLGTSVAPVDAWTLHGSGATVTEVVTYRGDDPNARALATVLAQNDRGRRVTRGMQCVAEETGRFVLAHGDDPAADIRGFIAARCGTPVVWPTVISQRLLPEEAPDRPLHPERDRQMLDAMVQAIGDDSSAGLWIGRSDSETVVTLAWGVPDIDLEPVPLQAEGRRQVDLRGRMRWDYDNLSGYATRGELGALPCQPIPGAEVSAPKFALRCPVGVDDESTVLELHASPRGRLLGRRVLRVLVSSRGSVPTSYQAPALSLPIGPDQHDDVTLAAGVNALRRKAGMSPVSASTGQSEVLADLLPHFLVATADPDQGELADQIALGMMAGRRVEAEIRWGAFFMSATPSNWSLERALAAELMSPYARSRLFDPAATTVAHASLSDPSHAMRRSVIATYSELRDRDYTGEIVALFEAIDRQRVAQGNEPVVRVQGADDMRTMTAVAHRVRDGELAPDEALDQLLSHFVEQTRREFRGTIMLPHTLEGWNPELQGPLLTAPRVAAAIIISHVRPAGSAWGRQLVLVVFTEL